MHSRLGGLEGLIGFDWRSLAVLCASALALVQTARIVVGAARSRRRLRLRMVHAAEGERRAPALLERRGYTVVARQVSEQLCLLVDGQSVTVAVRADLVVERGGRRYVAEVKTGREAPSLANAGTRRQLLEYRHAFAVDGVLLVDADQDVVREVVFPLPASRPPSLRSPVLWLAIGVALGAGMMGWAGSAALR